MHLLKFTEADYCILLCSSSSLKLNYFFFPLKLCTDQAEDQRVLTLAEQFLAAMPARIKNDQGDEVMQWEECSCYDASQSDDLGIESMGDDFDFDFNVADESTYHHYYRYVEMAAKFLALQIESILGGFVFFVFCY